MKSTFIKNNRSNLMNMLDNDSILVVFAGKAIYKSADETYSFTPNRNFYFLTGINRENFILVITKRNSIINETLFIEKNDPIMAKWIGEKMSIDEAKEFSGINGIDFIENFKNHFASLLSRYEFNNVYLDLERRGHDEPKSSSEVFADFVKGTYSYINIRNVYHKICELRMIKNQNELENIKEAIKITKEGIETMMKNAKPGMMEYEIEAYFDFTLTSKGVRDKAFKTIAASGKNATILHYSENNSKTCDGDLMLLDLGAQYNYYNGDISRTFPLNGRFTERQKDVYNVVLEAMKAVEENAKPGMTLTQLNDVAKKVLANGCKKLGLIKEDNELSRYYYHGVSHYLGADTHDVGSREMYLKPGMVITNEPGLYIEEERIGVRIEDDLLITENGCENLSKDIIKTVEDIEKFMKK